MAFRLVSSERRKRVAMLSSLRVVIATGTQSERGNVKKTPCVMRSEQPHRRDKLYFLFFFFFSPLLQFSLEFRVRIAPTKIAAERKNKINKKRQAISRNRRETGNMCQRGYVRHTEHSESRPARLGKPTSFTASA